MNSSRRVIGAARRPLVALFVAAIFVAPLAVAPATAAPECWRKSGNWMVTSAPAFPIGGRAVADLAIDAHAFGRMYVTNGSAAMLSSQQGCSWSEIYSLPEAPSLEATFTRSNSRIVSLEVPERAGNRAVLAIEETSPVGARIRPHVVTTADAGRTWQSGDDGLVPAGSPEHLAVAPSAPTVAYLIVDIGSGGLDVLQGSADGGRTWQVKTHRLPGDLAGFAVDPIVPTELWAWGPSGLYHSTDGGSSFGLVDEFAGESVAAVDVFHAPGSAPRIIAFLDEKGYARVSEDGGARWGTTNSPGVPDSVAHGPISQSLVATANGEAFAYGATVFSWVTLKAPVKGITGFVSDREGPPDFYGFAGSSIEVYQAPPGGNVDIELPGFVPPDISLNDPPEFEANPPSLSPARTRIRIKAGAQRRVPYRLSLSRAALPVDVYFLIDTSESADRFLRGVMIALEDIVNGLYEARLDVEFGLAEYRAYPDYDDNDPPRPPCDSEAGQLPGVQCERNFVYRQVLDMLEGSNGELADAIRALEPLGGGYYNASLPALYQTATGAGQEVTPPGPWNDVPEGQDASFRSRAINIVVHAADEPFVNRPYGRDNDPPDVPTFDEVAQVLNAGEIRQVGLALGRGALVELQEMAERTDAVAPVEGVDCDGDGATDIPSGAALVCTAYREELDEQGADLVTAIVNLVQGLAARSTVRLTAEGRDGVVASVSPEYPNVLKQAGGALDFSVAYRCPLPMAGETATIDLAARWGTDVLDRATATVLCGEVAKKKDFFSPFAQSVLALIPLAPGSPPPPVTQLSNATQAQSQAQAQGAMAAQRQEQPQVAFARAYRAALHEALAEDYEMSAFRDRGREELPGGAFLAGAAGLMAAAYAVAATVRNRVRVSTARARR